MKGKIFSRCLLAFGLAVLGTVGSTAEAKVAEIPPRPFVDATLEDDGFIIDAFDAAGVGAEVQFPYLDNKVYRIYTQMGFVTDITLEKNEKILYVGGGDTVRWRVDTSTVGNTYESYCHIYVKPLANGITTDFIINTDKRVYRLFMVSAGHYNPVVKWIYSGNKDGAISNEKQGMGYAGFNPAELDFDFRIDDNDKPWAPQSVFRSETKTYIRMKPDIVNYDLPAVFVIDDEGEPNLVAYRFVDGTFIVDRLFDKAILVAGKKGKVKITYKGGDE